MRAVDIIQKKKEGKIHTKEEIDFLVKGLLDGTVADYQMTAWLMAVYFKGLNEDETAYLTESFINSGDILDFSDPIHLPVSPRPRIQRGESGPKAKKFPP